MLVSVVVVSYNSALFIKECLNSILEQSYSNIELIVADDCSNDNTVDIAKQWLNENKSSFWRTCLIESSVNRGVTANCNSGLKEVNGKWIKFIAADDTICHNCIDEFVSLVCDKPEIECVFSNVNCFADEEVDFPVIWTKYRLTDRFNTIEIEDLLDAICWLCYIPAPGVFMKRSALCSVGGFNESIKTFEDTPLWKKYLVNNTRIYHYNKSLVNYRISSGQTITHKILSVERYRDMLTTHQISKKHVKSFKLLFNLQLWLLQYGLNHAESQLLFRLIMRARKCMFFMPKLYFFKKLFVAK